MAFNEHIFIFPAESLPGHNKDSPVTTTEDLLERASAHWSLNRTELRPIQTTSLTPLHPPIVHYKNGFVHGSIRAFEQGLNLMLRPDDVWLAIIVQLRLYFNGKVGDLRSKLAIKTYKEHPVANTHTAVIETNVVGKCHPAFKSANGFTDPEMRRWIRPEFTTTTPRDVSIADMVMLSEVSTDFERYHFPNGKAPSVTLLGTPTDWDKILRRVDCLPEYGEGCAEWAKLLIAVLKRMVATFYTPDSLELKEFWKNISKKVHVGSDGDNEMETISGWITAFSYWNEEGRRVQDFVNTYSMRVYTLDGVRFPVIRPTQVASGVVQASVKLHRSATNTIQNCTLITGCFGMQVSPLADGTTFRPFFGYWVLPNSAAEVTDATTSHQSSHNQPHELGGRSVSNP
ncbi:hypothetical protein BDV96DRAFT_507800 [Lophiotrema nucula]|uniref:Uncharacterized protein n=1 Tax=Lophiotrema nucula TaxID=690887 RepID=A0A6A5YGP9_9PLEO|nr:hypothetical protein BDV96DRAFT_507800 [Lophiotrema nucula]